jgi:XTP/dITP diphosphohydrolase|tara:strand:+ start:16874 stop:17461 length:588 start_codon:yes stop_codon:yes gene_type:complete
MRIVLASNNQHKLQELVSVLPASLDLVFQRELGVEEAEETGSTFIENAIIKARHAAMSCNLPAIADDSGLEVDFLKGSPGIYSSRFAGEGATDAENNEKLLAALELTPTEERSARFQCVIVFMQHALDPTPLVAQGTWKGRILTQPLGKAGFGYDPLFFIPSLEKSAAQLSEAEKNRISHRGLALARLQKLINLD